MLKLVPLWLRRAAFFAMLAICTAFFFVELPPAEPLMNDKLMHFIVFAILALGAGLSWPKQPFFPWIAIVIAVYGATIEVVQFFLPWRSAEWLDLLADTAGVVACGLVLVWLTQPKSHPKA